jgi:hypothetical protein
MRPLSLTDFFAPLSELYCCSAEEYKLFTDFTHTITGIKDRLKALAEPDDPKKKKKGKKR